MSESIFETFTDERGNISVRVSQEVQVLTREEADRIEAEYKRMQTENAKLRELCTDMWFWGYEGHMDSKSQEWQMKHIDGVLDRMRELGVDE